MLRATYIVRSHRVIPSRTSCRRFSSRTEDNLPEHPKNKTSDLEPKMHVSKSKPHTGDNDETSIPMDSIYLRRRAARWYHPTTVRCGYHGNSLLVKLKFLVDSCPLLKKQNREDPDEEVPTQDQAFLPFNKRQTRTMRSILLLTISIALVVADCFPQCENEGKCVFEPDSRNSSQMIYQCKCSYYFDGPSCTVPWRDDSKWMIYVNVYVALTTISFSLVLGWALYEIYKGGKKFWTEFSVVSYSIIMVTIGASIRVILWAIDPHTIRGITSLYVYTPLYSIPIICWFSAAFTMAVYWMETAHVAETLAERQRWPSYCLVALVYLLLIPTTIGQSIYPNVYATLIAYDACCIILFSVFIGLTIYFGVKMVNMFKDKPKLDQITHMMVGMTINFILTLLTVLVFNFASATPYPYISIHVALRAEEISICLCLLYAFSRKKKSEGEEDSQTMESRGITPVPVNVENVTENPTTQPVPSDNSSSIVMDDRTMSVSMSVEGDRSNEGGV
ncbi:hypothetical protein PROFUN_04456 [Planoprotostelium fungivorum]|uniref:EGF-like domain-containing protein n=1 Tax=Planoprotostelium fungivorum TaxID=1890364 RepID=A0A2P6NVY3_9EUKA|nr:hypothetical protein PROFUN_04456 [Planoprotostelium fungivorum]